MKSPAMDENEPCKPVRPDGSVLGDRARGDEERTGAVNAASLAVAGGTLTARGPRSP